MHQQLVRHLDYLCGIIRFSNAGSTVSEVYGFSSEYGVYNQEMISGKIWIEWRELFDLLKSIFNTHCYLGDGGGTWLRIEKSGALSCSDKTCQDRVDCPWEVLCVSRFSIERSKLR